MLCWTCPWAGKRRPVMRNLAHRYSMGGLWRISLTPVCTCVCRLVLCDTLWVLPVVVVSSADWSETDIVHVLDIGALGVRELKAWGPSVVHNIVDLQIRCQIELVRNANVSKASNSMARSAGKPEMQLRLKGKTSDLPGNSVVGQRWQEGKGLKEPANCGAGSQKIANGLSVSVGELYAIFCRLWA